MAGNGGFGGGPFGGTPWGGFLIGVESPVVEETVTITENLTVDVPYKVVSAVSLQAFVVRIDFIVSVDQAYAPNFDPANYTIPGLTVVDASPFPGQPNSVLLLTSEQLSIPYVVTVDPSIRSTAGDTLDPAFATAAFQGSSVPPTFFATAQSSKKIRLTFQVQMTINAAFEFAGSYQVRTVSGDPLTVVSAAHIDDGTDRKAEIIVDESLAPGAFYVVEVNSNITTADDQTLTPSTSLFQWEYHVPEPIAVPFGNFSGEVSGGLLGTPAGQVFFSPAYDIANTGSVIQVEEVNLCTRAFDVYEIPDIPDPPFLYTFSAPDSLLTASEIGAGTVLWAPAERVGLARINLADYPEDTYTPPVDGPADATLVETIDITSGGFLNDLRWETFPAATASIGVFTTADNSGPIGPGPTININLQP